MGQIGRRRFLAATGATLAAPIVRAQPTKLLPRVGFVLTTAPLATMRGERPAQLVMRGFLYGMRELGYVEGRDMVIERRSAEGDPRRLPELIRELVEARVDVIVVTGTIMVRYAMEATSSLPIVAAGMGEAQALQYAKSYAAPERNLTGVVVISGAVGGKRLQLVKEMLPRATRIAVLTQPRDWEISEKFFLAEGSAIGLELEPVEVRMPDMDAALNSLAARRVDALLVSSAPPFFVHAKRIVEAQRGTLDLGAIVPALDGEYEAKTLKGAVKVRPVFTLLRASLDADYKPEQTAKITGVNPAVVRDLARRVGKAKAVSNVTSSNFAKFYHGNLMERAQILVFALCGHMGKKGSGFSAFPFLTQDGIEMFALLKRPGWMGKLRLAVQMW